MALRSEISIRINELINERKWSLFRLSFESAVPMSTIYNIMLGNCKSCNLDSILNICRGLRIELSVFFDSPLFYISKLADD